GKYDNSHPELSNKIDGGYGKYSQQHPKFERAKQLNEEAAYHSTSFTGFQIMGANYESAGYSSAKEFGDAMINGTEDDHLDAFVNVVLSNKSWHTNLKNLNWTEFAAGYNGPKYKKNKYDEKMTKNYNDLKNEPTKGLEDDKKSSESSSSAPPRNPPPVDSA